jgi:hypothetical protein
VSSRSPPWEWHMLAARQVAHGKSSLAPRVPSLRAPGASVGTNDLQLPTIGPTGVVISPFAERNPTWQLAQVTSGRTATEPDNRYCATLLRWPARSRKHVTADIAFMNTEIVVRARSRTNAKIIGTRPDNLCWSLKVGRSWTWLPRSPITRSARRGGPRIGRGQISLSAGANS